MTENQRIVYRWLQENCTKSGTIKVSNGKIAEQFGWSQQYTHKILSQLISQGYLEERRKGTGQRSSIYSFSDNQSSSSDNQSQNPYFSRVGVVPKTKRGRLFGITPARKEDVEEELPVPVSRRSNRVGPMKKFRAKWDRVRDWEPTDIVCYYRWLYHTRFGIMPDIDWSVCCGTARSLLKRLGSPQSVKHYLQIAFVFLQFKPQGLNSLYHSTMYEKVREHWDAAEDLYDDYLDDFVFPWCKQKMLEESRRIAEEYTRHLVTVGLSPANRERRRLERKRRVNQQIDLKMRQNWHQYSEVRSMLAGIP